MWIWGHLMMVAGIWGCFMIHGDVGCTASVLVAHVKHWQRFSVDFEATKSSLDGLHAQQPPFTSIFNRDIIERDWKGSVGAYLRVSLRGAFLGRMHVDSDGEVWGLLGGCSFGRGLVSDGWAFLSLPTHPDSPIATPPPPPSLPCGWWTSSLL